MSVLFDQLAFCVCQFIMATRTFPHIILRKYSKNILTDFRCVLDYEQSPIFPRGQQSERNALFLAWDDFHARSRFALSTIPEEKWGTTRSLDVYGCNCERQKKVGADRSHFNSMHYRNIFSGLFRNSLNSECKNKQTT